MIKANFNLFSPAEVKCADTNVCSQFCSQQSGVDTCSCGFGFLLASDNAACTGERVLRLVCNTFMESLLEIVECLKQTCGVDVY